MWGGGVREELNELKNDVKDIILPANNQGQQVEQGINITSNCKGSGRNGSCNSEFVVVKSFGRQKLTMQHPKQINNRDTRSNQHMNKY